MNANSINVPFSAVLFDSATQVRVEINNEVVGEYAEALAAGSSFPPVVLFADQVGPAAKYYIGDGWHRLLAYQHNGDVTVPAVVHVGGRERAVKYALSANDRHGLKRTNADKRKAVEVALKNFGDELKTGDAIASICAVSTPFAIKVRSEFLTVKNSDGGKVMGKDGKLYPATKMRHEPRGEVEVQRERVDDQPPPVGGRLEDIEQTAREEARNPPTVASNALQYSAMAISALAKIERADPRRAEAFAEVLRWISSNS